MKKIMIAFLFLFYFLKASGQEITWNLETVIEFPRLGLLSLDNQDFLFISDLEGNLYQYNENGDQVNNFSPQRQAALTQLEASWTVNIFTFSTDLQEYRILDRFVNPVSENRIPTDLINLAKVATLGNNNIMWIFDEADLSLKQFDYRRNRILQHQPLNLILDRSSLEVIDIREYQNLVFLNIEGEGVYVLDNQGNLIRNIDIDYPQKLSFWKENLLFLEDGKIAVMDFKSGKLIKYPLPKDINPKAVMINQQNVFLYNENQVWIFRRPHQF